MLSGQYLVTYHDSRSLPDGGFHLTAGLQKAPASSRDFTENIQGVADY